MDTVSTLCPIITMIDLSFLTDEERETIRAVLRRDTDLKQAEEKRVKTLQTSVTDQGQLKYMTGEWFYETKAQRHQEHIDGSDIIRASLRQTILELSQMWPARPSFVSSDNQDVFVPPELSGLIDEPQEQLGDKSDQNWNPFENSEILKSVSQSPTKPRQNPFNNEHFAPHTLENLQEKDSILVVGSVEQTHTHSEEPLSSPEHRNSVATNLKQEHIIDTLGVLSASVLMPEPEQVINIDQDSLVELDVDCTTPTEEENNVDPVPMSSNRQKKKGKKARKGKKREVDVNEGGLSCESQDTALHQVSGDVCEPCHPHHDSPQMSNPFVADSPQMHNPFLTLVALESGQLVDMETETKEDGQFETKVADWPMQGLLSIQEESDYDINETHVLKSPAKIQEDGQINLPFDEPDMKSPETLEVITLPLTALQNTPFKETITSLSLEPAERDDPNKLFNLEEKENDFDPNLTSEPTREDIIKTQTEDGQTSPVVESKNDVITSQMELNNEGSTTVESDEDRSSRIESSLLFDLPKEDGTYRASPVLICEDTDDSLTGSMTDSQCPQPMENIAVPLPSSLCSNIQDSPIPFPRKSSPVQPYQIDDTKSAEEKECTESRTVIQKVDETPGSPTPLSSSSDKSIDLVENIDASHSDLITPESGNEKCEENAQDGSYRDKSDVESNTKDMTLKDDSVIQSSDKSQLNQHGITGDEEKYSQQSQHEAETESVLLQQRPLSPNRSPSKTCHPKILPRESSNPTGPRMEGSPLKTFPIDITPPTNDFEAQSQRPTPAARQRKSPSHEAKHSGLMDVKPTTEVIPHLPATQPEVCHPTNVIIQQSSPKHSTELQPDETSQSVEDEQEVLLPSKKSKSLTRLARSFVPQGYQHYLGSPEKAHRPPSQHGKAVGDGEGAHQISTSYDDNSSPLREDDDPSPLRADLKRVPSRPLSSSKSLETLTSHLREESSTNDPRGQLNISENDVSAVPPSVTSLSDPDQVKSVSVPVFQQEEMDSDGALENKVGWRSSISSLSSGLATMSSMSGSMSSLYPGDWGDIEIQGSIQFAVNYVEKLAEFHVFVDQCRDLAVAEPKKNRSDPYVKCYLLPDKTKKKTSVKKKTQSPAYKEVLTFKAPMEVLKAQKLNVSVWHDYTLRRNSFLGEVELDLSEWDFSNTQINEYALKPRFSAQSPAASPSRAQSGDKRGEMRVALRFLPQISHSKRPSQSQTGEVQIWVKECKNLPPVRGVIIDPFVKCAVLPDRSRKSRQKTRVVKRTANPMFNHTMVYDGFRPEDLREACIEITVWDHDRLNNHYIGGLRLGLGTGKSYGADVMWMDSTTEETNIWERMMQSHSEWVEDVLPLRMLVMANVGKSKSKQGGTM